MRPLTFAGVYAFKQKYFEQALEGLAATHGNNPDHNKNFDIRYSEPEQSAVNSDDTFFIATSNKVSEKYMPKPSFEDMLTTRWHQDSIPFNRVIHSGGKRLLPFNYNAVVDKLMRRPEWVGKHNVKEPSTVQELPAEPIAQELPADPNPAIVDLLPVDPASLHATRQGRLSAVEKVIAQVEKAKTRSADNEK